MKLALTFNSNFVASVAAVVLALSSSTPASAQPRHNPLRPYRAWVISIDTSRSPTEEQFRKLLAVGESIAENEVTFNDLVWLTSIGSNLAAMKPFPMPASGLYHADRAAANVALRAMKDALIAAIRQMSQGPGSTDLQSPIEAALNILRSHPNATARTLVIGSDFLTDTGRGRTSSGPPTLRSMEGIAALLLFTNPRQEYLGASLSPSALYQTMETKWTGYLQKIGASPVVVRPVDAVPTAVAAVGSQPSRNEVKR